MQPTRDATKFNRTQPMDGLNPRLSLLQLIIEGGIITLVILDKRTEWHTE